MSRSGYSDDCDYLDLYRASVARALKGKRGQAFLRELAAELDAMPEKALIANELINDQGKCCAIGVVCKSRGLDMSNIAYDDPWPVAKAIGVANSMAAEIAFMNDEWIAPYTENDEQRWRRMREWVAENILSEPVPESGEARV